MEPQRMGIINYARTWERFMLFLMRAAQVFLLKMAPLLYDYSSSRNKAFSIR